jgi:hypothetical protein
MIFKFAKGYALRMQDKSTILEGNTPLPLEWTKVYNNFLCTPYNQDTYLDSLISLSDYYYSNLAPRALLQ